jgi:hypothetical protein
VRPELLHRLRYERPIDAALDRDVGVLQELLLLEELQVCQEWRLAL